MDQAMLSKLITQSKNGDRNAAKQLLTYAYTPVFWQCRRLLNDPQLGKEMTYRILKSLTNQLDTIETPAELHRWLGNTAARLCMKKRAQSSPGEYIPDTTDASFPCKELTAAQTAQVAQILLDSLPEELRICLLLSVCCGIRTATIAQMTGLPEEAVAANISEAQLGIQEQMRLYQDQGVVFSGSLLVPDLLHNAMLLEEDPSAAAAMAAMALPPIPKAPVPPPRQPIPIVRILLCVAAALLLLLLLVVWTILRKGDSQQMPEPTEGAAIATVVTEMTTAPTTQPTTEPTTEETTAPTTEETTEETSEPTEPETTAATEPKKQTPTSSGTGSRPQTTPGTGTPTTPATGTADSSPTDPPGYNPGQGEDGHTHVLFTRPTGQKATCTRAATIYRICSICQQGIILDDPDNPPLGHDYQVNLVIAPTTTSKGYTNYRCTRCGDSYDADYVDPLPAPSTTPPETAPTENTPPEQPPESEAPIPEA